jgi:hydroxyacylglutathione hydrolase
MSPFEIIVVPALSDNYVYIARDTETDTTMVVDPGEAGPVLKALDNYGWSLTHILNTHHHGDHIGGNEELISKYNAKLIGPASENDRIPRMDQTVVDGDLIDIGGHKGLVLETPGHTRGHISVWFAESDALFCGDTLFALGCGRVFEGTMEEMWASLLKLRSLSQTAKIYCGHEYTLSNAKFALSIDSENNKLRNRVKDFETMRSEGIPTIPSVLIDELETNPFLRADDPILATAMGMAGADPVSIFAEIRRQKDNF